MFDHFVCLTAAPGTMYYGPWPIGYGLQHVQIYTKYHVVSVVCIYIYIYSERQSGVSILAGKLLETNLMLQDANHA
jgi:hypothetical protein